MTTGPLDGLRIVDMTNVVMGPFATQILGDLGADIIKLEAPVGDTTRKIPPMRNPNMGCTFLHLNRNKRSLVLDLKQPDHLAAFFRVIETADALISNIRPQAMARLGITWEKLQAVNPRLVSVALVGFRQNGPYAGRPVYEDLIQGLTAVPSMLVSAGSETPHYVPVTFNDHAVGQSAAIALLAAIRHCDLTGRGQEVQVPMFETMVQSTLGDHMGGCTFDPPLGPPGYKRILTSERRPFATKDGYVCVIIYTDKHWASFFQLVGKPELMADPRLADIGARTTHSAELYPMIAEEMIGRTTAEWLEALDAADIPAAPLHTLESLFDDPHLEAVGFFETGDHPTEGRITQMGIPSEWSESTPAIRRPAPRLGEHSAEILAEAGLSPDAVEALLGPPAAPARRKA